jgi:broad specificity phosphatase PhoE
MAVEVLFLRHGQTAWNTEHRRQGHSGPGLDDVGRGQARKAAQAVAKMHAATPVAAIYSSDLARAAETAAPIAAALGLPVLADPRLRERHQGDWQGQLTESIRAADPAGYEAVISDPLNGCPPGGETGQQVLDRLVDALDEIAARYDGERVVVVSHGGALSLVRWLALANLDPAYIAGPEWGAWIANCEVIPMIWPPAGRDG